MGFRAPSSAPLVLQFLRATERSRSFAFECVVHIRTAWGPFRERRARAPARRRAGRAGRVSPVPAAVLLGMVAAVLELGSIDFAEDEQQHEDHLVALRRAQRERRKAKMKGNA